jgi:hypothetical protein
VELSVAIVSYNAREELEACLSSVVAETEDGTPEIIVADNASTDGSVAMMQDRFPGVDVLESNENLGFARASNLCWRRAHRPLVLFLNSDTVVPEGALARLVAIMNYRGDIGALGPLLKNADGSIQMSFGNMLSLSAELRQKILNAGYRNGRGPLRGYVENLHARERTVDWVSGACLLTRRELLERVGGFDEEFFLYSEDVDLCARIRAQGARVLFTPAVEITHHRGRSVEKDRDKAYVESQRSRLHFYAKHYGQPRLGLLKLYMTTRLGVAYLFHPSARATYRSVLKVVFHGDSA